MSCTVYGLTGPNGKIRYIGQTRARDVRTRLGTHWRDAKRRPHSRLYKWMRETKDIRIVILKEDAIWDITETTLIAQYRRMFPNRLLNQLAGGSDAPKKWRRKKRGSKKP